MKTILIITTTTRGTIARVSYNLYHALKSSNQYRVIVFSVDGGDYFPYAKEDVFSCHARGMFRLFHIIRGIRSVKKRECVDLTISTLLAFNFYNLLSGIGEKRIGIFHAPTEQMKKTLGFLYYIFGVVTVKLCSLKFQELWAVAEGVKSSLSRDAFYPEKIHVAYNVHPIEFIREQGRKQCDLHLPDDYFISVGAIFEIKGVDRLLRAFSLFKTQFGSDTKLVICGKTWTDDFALQLESLIDKLSLSNEVILLGYQDNPYPYIAKSRALISSSYQEGLPGAIIESLILHRPVIATNSSAGVWEIFSEFSNYNPLLSSNFECEDGIITPNKETVCNMERLEPTKDDNFLSLAMLRVCNHNFSPSFHFISNLNGDNVLTRIKAVLN